MARTSVHLFLHTEPDLAVEILSPDQYMAHILDNIRFYLLYGVRLVWVIDPATASVIVQVPGQEARVLRAGDTLNGGDAARVQASDRRYLCPDAGLISQRDDLTGKP